MRGAVGADRAGVLRIRLIDLGDVTLSVTEAGAGPLVVLLHGFPDCSYTWRHQLPALAAAGYRVVAPDLRGYGASSRPRGVAAYGIERLTADVDRLFGALGVERAAAVIGHDWGGGIAWAFAMHHPRRLERLAILNAPHPVAFRRALRRPRQLLRSWYMFYFQLPWLPELGLTANDFAAVRAVFRRDPVSARAFTPEDVERHIDALRPPGTMTAAVNYYRALFRDTNRPIARPRPVECPVLVLWGERDRYLGIETALPDARWAPRARLIPIAEASHWVHLDAPERVNAELLALLGESA